MRQKESLLNKLYSSHSPHRLLSLFMAVAMILSLCAMTPFASAEEPEVYAITASPTTGGTIEVQASAEEGKAVAVVFSPDSGYKPKGIAVTKESGEGVDVLYRSSANFRTYRFIMPNEPVTVTAEFEDATPGLQPTYSASLSVEGSVATVTMAIANNPGVAKFQAVFYMDDLSLSEWDGGTIVRRGEGALAPNTVLTSTALSYGADLEPSKYQFAGSLENNISGTLVDFTGDGDMFTQTFLMLTGAPEGEYTIEIRDAVFINAAGDEYYPQDIEPLTFQFAKVAATGVSMLPETASIKTTETLQLNPVVSPGNATFKTVKYTSSNTAVATVSTSGLISPKAGGEVTITVTTDDGGFTDTCEVTVVVGVTGVTLTDSATRVVASGDTVQFEANVAPANAADKAVTWSSSNPSAATVDETGLVTAVAPGEAKITVTTHDGGKTAFCYVIVAPATTGAAARIGGTSYDTLDEALMAIQPGDELVLLKTQTAASRITLTKNCSVDLNGFALVVPGITVDTGVTASIENGTLYTSQSGTGGTAGGLLVRGTVSSLSECNIINSLNGAAGAAIQVAAGGKITQITGCTITSATGMAILLNGEISALESSVVTGGVNGANAYAAIQNGNAAALVNIYSGTYRGGGDNLFIKTGQASQSMIMLYGGSYYAPTTSAITNLAQIASGYSLSSTRDENGYYTVERTTYTVKIQVTPATASVTLVPASGGDQIIPVSSNNGLFTYTLNKESDYTYTVSADNYTTKTRTFTASLNNMTIPVDLTPADGSPGGGDPSAPVTGGSVITSGGTYTVGDNATGTILVITTEPVTIVGKGIVGAQIFRNLTIDCVAGSNLTIRDFAVNNNFGLGTPSGETNPGQHGINFRGTGNALNLESVNMIENQDYVQGCGIHVPKGVQLTINGPGTLYMYKYSQGAGIGGASYEASGALTFAGGDIFIKGSKTGPLIGGDAGATGVNPTTNDDIHITGGTLVLIPKAQGAAIGSSHLGTCAGNVYLEGGNLTLISDFNAGLGFGGNPPAGAPAGNLYISGGSFKAVRTGNSLYGNSRSGDAYVDDSLVTATKLSGSGEPVYRLIFDTTKLVGSAGSFTVSTDSFSYSGGLHQYKYTESTTSTVANFGYDSSDKNLYFYLTGKDHTLTVNGETVKATWNSASNTFTLTYPTGAGASPASSVIVPEITTSGNTSSASISAGDVTKAISDAVSNAAKDGTKPTIAIVVDAPETSTTVQTKIPKSSLAELTSSAVESVTVSTPVGSITLDSKALDSIAGQATGSDVTLSVAKVDNSTLTGKQKEAVGDAVVIDLTITSGGTTISNFGGGGATVSVPYTLRDGESAEGIVIWFLADDGTLTQVEGARYDAASGMVVFTVSHFSQYVIDHDLVAAWKNPFTDIKKTDWHYEYIYFACTNGLFNGTTATTFSPNTPMTRGMFVTVLGRLDGIKDSDYTATSFTDVKTGTYYSAGVEWAAKNNIAGGVGGGLFAPDKPITREEMAAMLYRYAAYKKLDVTKAAELSGFPDAASVSDFAGAALKWCVSEGYINGIEGALSPKSTATRAQVATILQRFCEDIE